MVNRSMSRSERRMERKQAIILLLLVLAVSLVSFSLGVMVGRGGAAKQVARSGPLPVPPRPAEAAPATPALPSVDQTASSASAPSAPVPAAEDQAAEEPAETLSFYETLPRGDLPLGSGINLPPAATSAEPVAPRASEPAKVKLPEPVSQPAPRTATAKRPVEQSPAPMATGSYVVQLASFKDAAAARKLQQQLGAKGYSLFVEAADLGNKGVWHRVYAGPYADRTAADRVAGQLQQKAKISPLVRKR